MQERWRIVGDEIRFRPERLDAAGDDRICSGFRTSCTDDLFDAYDRFAPGRLERRIAQAAAAMISAGARVRMTRSTAAIR